MIRSLMTIATRTNTNKSRISHFWFPKAFGSLHMSTADPSNFPSFSSFFIFLLFLLSPSSSFEVYSFAHIKRTRSKNRRRSSISTSSLPPLASPPLSPRLSTTSNLAYECHKRIDSLPVHHRFSRAQTRRHTHTDTQCTNPNDHFRVSVAFVSFFASWTNITLPWNSTPLLRSRCALPLALSSSKRVLPRHVPFRSPHKSPLRFGVVCGRANIRPLLARPRLLRIAITVWVFRFLLAEKEEREEWNGLPGRSVCVIWFDLTLMHSIDSLNQVSIKEEEEEKEEEWDILSEYLQGKWWIRKSCCVLSRSFFSSFLFSLGVSSFLSLSLSVCLFRNRIVDCVRVHRSRRNRSWGSRCDEIYPFVSLSLSLFLFLSLSLLFFYIWMDEWMHGRRMIKLIIFSRSCRHRLKMDGYRRKYIFLTRCSFPSPSCDDRMDWCNVLVCFGNILWLEDIALMKPRDSRGRPILPYHCREASSTYRGELFATVCRELPNGTVTRTQRKLGTIPIMVGVSGFYVDDTLSSCVIFMFLSAPVFLDWCSWFNPLFFFFSFKFPLCSFESIKCLTMMFLPLKKRFIVLFFLLPFFWMKNSLLRSFCFVTNTIHAFSNPSFFSHHFSLLNFPW